MGLVVAAEDHQHRGEEVTGEDRPARCRRSGLRHARPAVRRKSEPSNCLSTIGGPASQALPGQAFAAAEAHLPAEHAEARGLPYRPPLNSSVLRSLPGTQTSTDANEGLASAPTRSSRVRGQAAFSTWPVAGVEEVEHLLAVLHVVAVLGQRRRGRAGAAGRRAGSRRWWRPGRWSSSRCGRTAAPPRRRRASPSSRWRRCVATIFSSSSCSWARVSASSAPKGSSISSIFGSIASARAMPTRCFMPPEISCGRLCRGVAHAHQLQRGQRAFAQLRLVLLGAEDALDRQVHVVRSRSARAAASGSGTPRRGRGPGPRARGRRAAARRWWAWSGRPPG